MSEKPSATFSFTSASILFSTASRLRVVPSIVLTFRCFILTSDLTTGSHAHLNTHTNDAPK